MGSCAAPSAKGDDKFITTDYLQQCHPARRHAAAARPPRWCAVGAARLRAGTAARLRVAAPYCALAAARGRLRGTLRHTTSDPLSCTIHG
uniref:hypothetical protein n=1 Tax=Klebsiella pneumoniae TaxID=573 RepID=UPI001331B51B|nr:hypothetical protein [Klebsiella pneumoniae]